MTLARLWFRAWDPLGAASALVAQWERPPGLDTERALQDSLYEYLQRRLPGYRITREYAHDRLKADIVIEEAVAIELKHDLAHKSEFQRLIGQLEDYAQWGIPLVVVLVGRTNPDFAHRVSEHLEQRFNSLHPTATLIMRP